ncbi:DUF3102 domain-containing protein [Staphylococcus warneri]|uniref:DUF3102 domain-containing protein n=1 Tax=Staphylococcus warneri TaxID=1292 RepID=UPI001072C871|nr:DUF3102 domain-containing protein [Staphylococcus warneri]MBF0770254.1 DUF3102 domain-containing protein [Staphylococcus warneri]TFU64798.1 DUF3102 domain-containing protein [Staphylococcus warneri]
MNELQLSNDLTTIETEIKSYQNIAGQSIFEIGRRLKHVKENDLAHGEFGKWLEKVNLNKSQASKFIKVSEEFSEISPGKNLGLTVMYELATLPDDIREEPQELRNGEVKKPSDMTRKELEDLKRQIKQRDEQNAQLQSQVEQAQRSEEIAKKQLEDAESREPEIKREVKEVIPPHVKAQLSDRQQMIDAKDKEIKQLQEQLSKAEEQKQKFEKQDYLEEDEQIASINFQVESTVLEIKDNINRFLNENASTAFREAAIARASKKTKNQIYDGVEELEAFCRTMRQSLNSNVIVGG